MDEYGAKEATLHRNQHRPMIRTRTGQTLGLKYTMRGFTQQPAKDQNKIWSGDKETRNRST